MLFLPLFRHLLPCLRLSTLPLWSFVSPRNTHISEIDLFITIYTEINAITSTFQTSLISYGMVTPVNILPEWMPSLRAEKKSLCCVQVQIVERVICLCGTPQRMSSFSLARGRSMCQREAVCVAMEGMSNRALANVSTSSSPTS